MQQIYSAVQLGTTRSTAAVHPHFERTGPSLTPMAILGGDVQVENKILQAAGLFKYYFDGEADGFTQTIINRPRTAKVQRDAGTAEGGAEPSKPVVAILIGSTLKGVVGAYEGNGESCQFARDGSCDESKDNKDGAPPRSPTHPFSRHINCGVPTPHPTLARIRCFAKVNFACQDCAQQGQIAQVTHPTACLSNLEHMI